MKGPEVNEPDYLADRFEANRSHLRAVAYRMLGSVSEADDAVQEAWLRLSRTDVAGREPRRLAHDGGRAGLARHAALAQRAPRTAAGNVRAGADREQRRRGRPRARGADRRLRRARAAGGARNAVTRGAAR